MKKLFVVFAFLVFLVGVSIAQKPPKSSAWDGVAYCIKDYYKKNAHDPKSIKYSEASYILYLNNGKFSQKVKVRGKNAFGAKTVQDLFFLIGGSYGDFKVEKIFTAEEFNKYGVLNGIKVLKKFDTDGKVVF